jgi:hypothetical protein
MIFGFMLVWNGCCLLVQNDVSDGLKSLGFDELVLGCG